MSDADETCDNCGAYLDAMNDEAISRMVNDVQRLWCGVECAVAWTQKVNQPW